MTIIDIINKKRKQQELTKEELAFFLDGYLKGEIADYQASALLMAITIQGMSEQETIDLTELMLKSGEVLSLRDLSGIKVDKHSTGGIGDKTTLILGPLVASCGLKMAKMSGRGLGYTGGTIDKLEAIPGFQVALTEQEFHAQVEKNGLAIVSQTGDLVPADKKLYALRDVTGTVESLPLIASSIMSKKLASGADLLLLDVKVGNGALMKTIAEASKLAHLMVKIGTAHGRKTIAVITDMEQPLGMSIGNSLEVLESIEVLKGKGPKDLRDLVIQLSALFLHHGLGMAMEEATQKSISQLENGSAYAKFLELVTAQGGRLEEVAVASRKLSIKSNKTGYITKVNALLLGELSRQLGAGRIHKEDAIDYGVGIVLKKKVGDYVLEDEELLEVYWNQKSVSIDSFLTCFTIGEALEEPKPLIYEIVM